MKFRFMINLPIASISAENITAPANVSNAAMNCSVAFDGVTSPYPRVVNVTKL